MLARFGSELASVTVAPPDGAGAGRKMRFALVVSDPITVLGESATVSWLTPGGFNSMLAERCAVMQLGKQVNS